MKTLLFIHALILFHGVASSGQPDIHAARTYFKKGADNEEIALKFYRLMEGSSPNTTPLLLGYKGMSEALMAKHAFNPFSKLYYFNKAKTSLNRAIQLKPQDAELRYLRFAIQTNAPEFLSYTANIEEDKDIIIKNIAACDAVIKEDIVTYMLHSKHCTTEEKRKLSQNLNP